MRLSAPQAKCSCCSEQAHAIWAEKNSVHASELQEINKLIKEAERLHAVVDTASIAVSDAEDCGSEDDSRAMNSVQAGELQ